MENKGTIVFDFDGVINSYTSGWKGYDIISDPIVPNTKILIKELRKLNYNIVVVSTRCKYPSGIKAIENYLKENDIVVDDILFEKPPALCYIDDRAICFDGNENPFILIEKIINFKPWNK